MAELQVDTAFYLHLKTRFYCHALVCSTGRPHSQNQCPSSTRSQTESSYSVYGSQLIRSRRCRRRQTNDLTTISWKTLWRSRCRYAKQSTFRRPTHETYGSFYHIRSCDPSRWTIPFMIQHRNSYCFHIFHIKICETGFWPSRSSKVKYDCANRKHISTFKIFAGSKLVSVAVFKICRMKGFSPWPLTSQGHANWSPWAIYIISVRSNIVSLAVLDIFHVRKYDLDFWPPRIIWGQIWRCQSKVSGSYI